MNGAKVCAAAHTRGQTLMHPRSFLADLRVSCCVPTKGLSQSSDMAHCGGFATE